MTKWVLSTFFIMLFLLNSFGLASAQDEGPTPSSSPDPSEEPTDVSTPLPDPSETPQVSPTETETPSLTPEPTSTAEPTTTPGNNIPFLGEPRPLDESGANLAHHPSTGKVNFIGASFDAPIQNPLTAGLSAAQGLDMMLDNLTPEDAARAFLIEYGHLFGLSDPSSELVLMRENQPDERRSIVRFQQQYQGVPVFAGELVVQMDAAGNIVSANGEILPDINLSTQPGITAQSAQDAARLLVSELYGIPPLELQVEDKGLWFYNPILISPEEGVTRLVWRMEVTSQGAMPVYEIVLVDAASGDIALHFNQAGGAKVIYTYDMQGSSGDLPGVDVCIYNNTYQKDEDLTCETSGNVYAQYAHLYAGDFYDFFKNYHNRDSFDNAGAALISSVNFGSTTGFENGAFWNGSQAIFGTGYAQADDIVAHEFTHGFTQHTSGLYNYYQSGAIAESLSDMWGEFIDLSNSKGNDAASVRWLIGEDNPGGAVRSMSNPTSYSQPDKITSSYYTTGTADNGGIHTNSGVNNKAVSLLVDGGTFNGYTITGIGLAKVSAIYYEAQTNLLVSGSDYLDLSNLLYQSCVNIVGDTAADESIININDCWSVQQAASAVEMEKQPTSTPTLPFANDPPFCPEVSQVTYLFSDDLENGDTKWSYGLISGQQQWSLNVPSLQDLPEIPHSGVNYFYADDSLVSSQSYVATNPSSPINIASADNGTYLYFYHNLLLNDDQGTVQYQINGGTWTDISGLPSVNGYNQTTYFSGDSKGYVGTRYDLSSLAGSTNVKFRWVLNSNVSGYNTGWYLDDVMVYECDTPTAMPAGIYDDTDTKLIYTGTWTAPTGVAEYNGTRHQTNVGGSKVSFTFYGTRVHIYYSGYPGYRGKVNIRIDGNLVGVLDQYALFYQLGIPWSSNYLTRGQHTIEMEYQTGQAADTYGIIDYIKVENDDPPEPVSAGKFDDFDKNITYLGSWAPYPLSTGDYKTTRHQTANEGAQVRFSFIGTKISLIYSGYPNRGLVDIYIDGSKVTTLNQYTASLVQGKVWSSSTLARGEHTIELRYVAGQDVGKGVVVDAFEVYDPLYPVRNGTYDDTDASLIYTGTWTAPTGVAELNGTRHQTNIGGSKVSMTFYGTRFHILYSGYPGYRGKVSIKVDGVQVGILDQYALFYQLGIPWSSDFLWSGAHTVEMEYLTGQAADLYGIIDAIKVEDTPPPTHVAAGTYDDFSDHVIFIGAWAPYSVSTGDYQNTRHQTAVEGAEVRFDFTGRRISLIYSGYPNRGLVDIYIDGSKVTTLNQYSATYQQNLKWTSSLLASGNHTIELKYVSGQEVGRGVVVDGFIVANN